MSIVNLNSDVNMIYGIGPESSEKLARLGVSTVYDLISYLPFRYSDWTDVRSLFGLNEGDELSFYGTVTRKPSRAGVKRTSPVTMMVADTASSLTLMFFNSPYLIEMFERGDKCFVHGTVTTYHGKLQMVNPHIEKEVDGKESRMIRPVYRLTAGLNSNQINKWVKTALKIVGDKLIDVVPSELTQKEGLCTPLESFNYVHFPDTMEQAAMGRRRIAYEELILLGVGMKLSHTSSVIEKAIKVIPSSISQIAKDKWNSVKNNIGFELTLDQKNAIKDIQKDLMTSKPMNRLVQGDVGSGKTAVAILSMAMTAIQGKQSALLAPTSVLAKQHYDNACKLLEGSGISVELLLGKTKATEKARIKKAIQENKASVIIGTHALLSDDFSYSNLALVVADEQHRFGVKQREKLLHCYSENSQINSVHNLVMTATPIPRTLAMVIYADMDTSVIKQKPCGRQEIETSYIRDFNSPEIFSVLEEKLSKGEQAYIVCPRISPNEDELCDDQLTLFDDETELHSVTEMIKLLKKYGISDKYETKAIYGSLKEETKLKAMEDFLSRKTQILVTTTVIEVGVDNPNATLMVIYDADRFGLSTLHQLRGRVGRGTQKSHCLLVSQSNSPLAIKRLELMTKCSDGFELAGKDLDLRGPGDVFGTRQHGIPTLRAANLFTDVGLATQAVECVNEVFSQGGIEADQLRSAIMELFNIKYANKIMGDN